MGPCLCLWRCLLCLRRLLQVQGTARRELQLLLCLQVQERLKTHQQGLGLGRLLLLLLLTGRVMLERLQGVGMVLGWCLHLCLLLCR